MIDWCDDCGVRRGRLERYGHLLRSLCWICRWQRKEARRWQRKEAHRD